MDFRNYLIHTLFDALEDLASRSRAGGQRRVNLAKGLRFSFLSVHPFVKVRSIQFSSTEDLSLPKEQIPVHTANIAFIQHSPHIFLSLGLERS